MMRYGEDMDNNNRMHHEGEQAYLALGADYRRHSHNVDNIGALKAKTRANRALSMNRAFGRSPSISSNSPLQH